MCALTFSYYVLVGGMTVAKNNYMKQNPEASLNCYLGCVQKDMRIEGRYLK